MRYAPADEKGFKPWVVTRMEWGRTTCHLEWAESAAQAAYQNRGRQRNVSAHARRATPEDVERFGDL